MPLTDDDFNVAPAMFPSKKKSDSKPYAVPSASSNVNDILQRKPLSGLSVSKEKPLVNHAKITPAVSQQASKNMANLAASLPAAQMAKDLANVKEPEEGVDVADDPKDTTEVAIYKAMDDIAPYENTIQWYPATSLPGVKQDIVKMMGKQIFSHYTTSPMKDVYAIATLVNPEERVAVMYNGLKKKGQFVADVQYDFEATMPGYTAEAKVYRYKGLEFLLVQDFAGYYVYAWDKSSSLLSGGDAKAAKQLESQTAFFRSKARTSK